jgi:hypothetical protein
MFGSELLWKPLLEAAAQTIVGAVGGYAFTHALQRATRRNSFDGSMDLWRRGLHENVVSTGDQIVFDGLISPYSQLFPGDPMDNATRWNQLYAFEGKINSEEYQAIEFFAGSDAALRIGSLNGETLVGLYSRYGFVGDGLIGVVPTSLLLKVLPDFFQPSFFGARARVCGRLARCPAQHGFVAEGIARRSGIYLDTSHYKNVPYLQINKISPARYAADRVCTLLGSAWAVTESDAEQYLVQYGYISEPSELQQCNSRIIDSRAWKKARVFYDEMTSPSKELGFRRAFIG